ncbi:MAG: protein adenylyltransferase SelO family protein [Caulobacterales bacterium]|uniref:protein adenylyltransferase SelO family protein n=1 Tax=Glycocaulis sp. TaxID=1969725 RepID=UPI003F9ECAA2
MAASYRPDPRFVTLGAEFADPVEPADFPAATERWWNDRWAGAVGLDTLDAHARTAHFHRFEPLPDNQPRPLALRYHGHQFRTYNPQIGDGRGFLFAQLRDGEGRLLDLGTKGSGQTPFSRTGDGRLTLKGAVRELLASHMLEARGVYTSKTLSIFETGEALHRGDEPSPTRSAVLTRLSHSHVRIGMFQRHAYFNRPDLVEALMDYAIDAFHPEAGLAGDAPARAAAFLEHTVAASARLAAEWMAAGFVHGVLNTDNLVVTGESFDYGPWRFLPVFEPGFTAAYFDEGGLYAYGRQPESVLWALEQLAGSLTLIGEEESLIKALMTFPDRYRAALYEAWHRRLGLKALGGDADGAFLTSLLRFMHESQLPFEGVVFDWFGGEASARRALSGPRAEAYRSETFAAIRGGFESREPVRPERLSHPYFNADEPADMVFETMEAAWAPIAAEDDWSALHVLLAAVDAAREGYDLGRGRSGFLDGQAE